MTQTEIIGEQNVTKTTQVVTPITSSVPGGSPQKTYETKKAIFRTYQIIWYILGMIEILLAFRVVLKALGANPASGFTSLIYSLSGIFAGPFSGILGTTATQGSVFEWSTFIAGIVYFIVAFGLVQLMQLIKPTTPQEVHETVDNV
ncbi:MAG: YggT family protein [Patescibacteria group bacterium]